jgi:hypothetical protein
MTTSTSFDSSVDIVDGIVCPVDPMELLNCESCQ